MSGDEAKYKPSRREGFSLRPTGAVLLTSNPESLMQPSGPLRYWEEGWPPKSLSGKCLL